MNSILCDFGHISPLTSWPNTTCRVGALPIYRKVTVSHGVCKSMHILAIGQVARRYEGRIQPKSDMGVGNSTPRRYEGGSTFAHI